MNAISNVVPLHGDEELFRVPPGEYPAIYVTHKGFTVFQTAKLRVDFSLLEHPGIVLSRWYRVTDYRSGRIKAGKHSSLVREVSATLGTRQRHDRVSVSSLSRIPVKVLVRDVVSDSEQSPLHEVNRYSVIERLIGRDA